MTAIATGMEIPETRYAKSGDVHIAYQQFGTGTIDLVFVPGWASHIDLAWEGEAPSRFLERLGKFARVVWFDKRGTGLSDRVGDLPILEVRADDVRAVMDAVGLERAVIFGISEGGSMSALFAAAYPERTNALILFGAFACRVRTEEYPWAPTAEEREAWIRSLESGRSGDDEVAHLAPSRAKDPAFVSWFRRYGRASVSPSAAVALARMNTGIDIRGILPAIHVPTLVLQRTGDLDVSPGNGRYLGQAIPGAKLVELPGNDHLVFTGDIEPVLGEIEEFLTGHPSHGSVDRFLTTILFTDLVGSTEAANAMGDHAWAELLSRHHYAVRADLQRYGGREVKTTGDGFLATFDGPARAVKCAAAIRRSLAGMNLAVRCGLHTGECESLRDDVGGIGVHIAARVMSLAGPGQILVTRTVRDLTSGSGITFVDQGERALKGLADPWQLFEASIPNK
jgi:class 3 adenylate cyclase